MLRISLIAAALGASLAASSASANDDYGAGGAPTDPAVSDPQDRAPPVPERRRHREPPRRRHDSAGGPPAYGAPARVVEPYIGAGEWSYGQPQQHEAPPPSPRGLHNGLWYY